MYSHHAVAAHVIIPLRPSPPPSPRLLVPSPPFPLPAFRPSPSYYLMQVARSTWRTSLTRDRDRPMRGFASTCWTATARLISTTSTATTAASSSSTTGQPWHRCLRATRCPSPTRRTRRAGMTLSASAARWAYVMTCPLTHTPPPSPHLGCTECLQPLQLHCPNSSESDDAIHPKPQLSYAAVAMDCCRTSRCLLVGGRSNAKWRKSGKWRTTQPRITAHPLPT